MRWELLQKKVYRAVFEIFAKAIKVEYYPKNIMGVTFGKMLVLGIAKNENQQNVNGVKT